MSETANELIERAELETGVRVDDPDDPRACYVLLGAVARMMGKSKLDQRDDFAAGMLIANDKPKPDSILADLLKSGIDPATLIDLFG